MHYAIILWVNFDLTDYIKYGKKKVISSYITILHWVEYLILLYCILLLYFEECYESDLPQWNFYGKQFMDQNIHKHISWNYIVKQLYIHRAVYLFLHMFHTLIPVQIQKCSFKVNMFIAYICNWLVVLISMVLIFVALVLRSNLLISWVHITLINVLMFILI
jgi:hypothetical protein